MLAAPSSDLDDVHEYRSAGTSPAKDREWAALQLPKSRLDSRVTGNELGSGVASLHCGRGWERAVVSAWRPAAGGESAHR